MTTRIQQTETYNSLSLMMKQLIIKRQSRLVIEHAYNVATHIGYDAWEKQSGFCNRNKNIVKELLAQDKVKK